MQDEKIELQEQSLTIVDGQNRATRKEWLHRPMNDVEYCAYTQENKEVRCIGLVQLTENYEVEFHYPVNEFVYDLENPFDFDHD